MADQAITDLQTRTIREGDPFRATSARTIDGAPLRNAVKNSWGRFSLHVAVRAAN